MTTLTTGKVLTEELSQFAHELREAGFRTYVFTSDVKRVENGGREACATHLGFSREVDGRECRASVSQEYRSFGGYTFSMPIKPSREHGSAMFIGGDSAPEFDELTLENARLYASPTGRNALVGTHENYAPGFAELYTEVVDAWSPERVERYQRDMLATEARRALGTE